MNRKVLTSFLVIGLALVAIIGGTLAWFTAEDSVSDNVFEAGTVKISASEEVTTGAGLMDNWNPGDYVEKTFTIENTGSKAIALRGMINGEWGFAHDADDPVVITDESDPAWTKDGDHYYYNGPIAAGATVTLVLGVRLDGDKAVNEFQEETYTLSAKFQAIQASHADEWDWDEFDNY